MKMRIWNYAGLTAAILMAAGCAGSPSEGDETTGAESAADRAISEARAAIEKADDRGCLWRDTESILTEAEDAADASEYAEAEELANEALFQAEQGMEQCNEQERLFEEGKNIPAEGAADDVSGEVMGPAVSGSGSGSYTVERGDTLWGIAGMATIYDDPYQWPLIFKANRDRIEDADLIHPGQRFSIRRDYSRAEVEAAVEHARTRGEWSLGRTEQSDMRYLRR
ncbi:LysM domain-containing protein [Thiohalospira halophila DSM 15071]|uniref:LysM domain-containing protein n=1 Tax=Thiohalospira halophila DSM 15071 TaxID=1123397 RepID=A0A1I1QA43_9GAMM|nr:LysM peptidoglycan-binding domain-containing protein [Thiohalospira halophila]SFD19004.1 LysM domain-containing protein [Thiohalospira halophila DSM 15071]